MLTRYTPGNKYSPWISIADAAVEWMNFPEEELRYVFVKPNGLPIHLDNRMLYVRAEVLILAIDNGQVRAKLYGLDNQLLPIDKVMMIRKQFLKYIGRLESET